MGLLCLALRKENISDEAKRQAKEFIDAALQDEKQTEVIFEALILATKRNPWWAWWSPYASFVDKHLDSKNEAVRLLVEKAVKTKLSRYMKKRKPDTRVTIAKLQAKLSYAQLVAKISSTKGDSNKGKPLFSRCNCANCHAATMNETPKGPSLAVVANKFDQKHILESMLKPSAKIKQGYETTVFVMNDGRVIQGFISSTGAEVIEIRNDKGTPLKIKVKEIDKRRTMKSSMMPNDIVGDLTVEEFSSLLAYLRTLK